MNLSLNLYLDAFEPRSAPIPLPKIVARAVYVLDGALALRGDGGSTESTLGANSATSLPGSGLIAGGSLATRLLRWELVPAGNPAAPLAKADGLLESRLLLGAPLSLDASQPWLLRCDRVDFPPAGEALTHTHQGPGTRCLLSGSIRIDTQGDSHHHGPLGAWFESGPDPVYAAADAAAATAFARVMVLPRVLLGGKSSIKYVRPEDADKPKTQRYQVFVDEPIELAVAV